MSTYAPRQWAYALALLGIIGFIICFFWGSLLSEPALKEMHMDMLRMSYFGFNGMNTQSFIFGIIQTGVWGLVIGWALATSLNLFERK